MTNDTQTVIELLPCPLCNSIDVYIQVHARVQAVRCRDCGLYLDRPVETVDEAVRVWNTRTLTAEIARKDEAMLTDVSEMRFHRNGSVIGSTFQGQWWIGKAAGQFATALDAYKSLAVPNGEA